MKRHLFQYGLFRSIHTSFRRIQQAVIIAPNGWVQRNRFRKAAFVTKSLNIDMVQDKYQKRYFSHKGMFEDDDYTSDEDEEFDEHLIPDDGEYARLVQDAFGQPYDGHKVFIVQPVDTTKKEQPTTGHLQLEESTALVKSVPQWTVVGNEIFEIRGQMAKTLFGKKQMTILKERLQSARNASAVFVSVDLLKREQLKALQTQLGIPVLDRYSVVIQIFKAHARTQEAKLQVSVAEVYFLRSRLIEVQEGRDEANAALTGGSGRTYIQARQFFLMRRERKLKAELDELKKQRNKLRENRKKKKIPTVAVIGYTNCGKTTLIKAVTGDVRMVPQDQLFATLDVTVHAGSLPNTMTALFVDTVGFISNIPRTLMQAFSATLEDAIMADLVIHVEDLSNPDRQLQRDNVLRTIKNMLSPEQYDTMLHVGNKIDKLNFCDIVKEDNTVYVSAETGIGLDVLREEIQNRVMKNSGFLQKKIRIPLSGDHLSFLYKEATVVSTEDDIDQENLIVNIVISAESYEKFKHRYGKRSQTVQKPF